ncbi:MAG TPA: hypothetical protein DEH78_08990 [Solibacterales bacterium]|nr:hypothetical protein [Bryobacterales bacterium]
MSYSAADLVSSVEEALQRHDIPPVTREEWNGLMDEEWSADEWPPQDSDGLKVLSYRVRRTLWAAAGVAAALEWALGQIRDDLRVDQPQALAVAREALANWKGAQS